MKKEKTKEVDHSVRAHSELGGSSAARWLNCTASVILLRDIKAPEPGVAALEGTKAHELSEKMLASFLNHKKTGNKIHVDTTDYDDAMISGANLYVETIWDKVLYQSIDKKRVNIELPATLSEKYKMYGHIDFVALQRTPKGKIELVIYDYKYGFGEVFAEENPQLLYYACAVQEALKVEGKPADVVRVGIVQPRIPDSVKEWSLTSKQLEAWKKKFIKAAEIIYDAPDKVKLKVGSHCKYCPAKSVCTEYNKDLSSKSGIELIPYEEDSVLPAVETLSDEKLLKIKAHSKLIKDYLKAVDDLVLSRAVSGNKLEGTKLIWGRSISQWDKTNLMEVENLGKKYGIDIYNKKPKGITAMQEEIFNAIQESVGVTPKKADIKRMIEPYLVKSEPKLKVALVSEKGDEVDITSLEDVRIEFESEYEFNE
jgi:CRISPR/Cas system-associated exonuclease Cas4 (RecB family)